MGLPKDYSKFNDTQKRVYVGKQLDKYGVDRIKDEQEPELSGVYSYDLEKEQKALTNAMNNNYSIRQSLQHGKQTGAKEFKDLDHHVTDMNNAFDVRQGMDAYGRRALGMKENKINDHEISNKLYTTSRQNDQDSIDDRFDAFKQTSQKQQSKNTGPVELSDRAKNALGDYSFNAPEKTTASSNDLAYDPNAGVKTNKAGSFLNDYKLDIQRGIAKDGTPGRGPNSIHNKF